MKGINRSPKTTTAILNNLRKVFEFLRSFEKMNSRYLWNQFLVMEGNSDLIWGLLDDIWYFYHNKISPFDAVNSLGGSHSTSQMSIAHGNPHFANKTDARSNFHGQDFEDEEEEKEMIKSSKSPYRKSHMEDIKSGISKYSVLPTHRSGISPHTPHSIKTGRSGFFTQRHYMQREEEVEEEEAVGGERKRKGVRSYSRKRNENIGNVRFNDIIEKKKYNSHYPHSQNESKILPMQRSAILQNKTPSRGRSKEQSYTHSFSQTPNHQNTNKYQTHMYASASQSQSATPYAFKCALAKLKYHKEIATREWLKDFNFTTLFSQEKDNLFRNPFTNGLLLCEVILSAFFLVFLYSWLNIWKMLTSLGNAVIPQ